MVGPFLQLQLDLPPSPLYADATERNIIPQVRDFIDCFIYIIY